MPAEVPMVHRLLTIKFEPATGRFKLVNSMTIELTSELTSSSSNLSLRQLDDGRNLTMVNEWNLTISGLNLTISGSNFDSKNQEIPFNEPSGLP